MTENLPNIKIKLSYKINLAVSRASVQDYDSEVNSQPATAFLHRNPFKNMYEIIVLRDLCIYFLSKTILQTISTINSPPKHQVS